MNSRLCAALLCSTALFSSSLRGQGAAEQATAPASPEMVQQLTSLARATGAMFGGILFSSYLGIVHTEHAHEAKMDSAAVELQVKRHMAATRVLSGQIAELRKSFGSDPSFISFLDNMEKDITALNEQATALLEVIKGGTKEATGYAAKKEVTRKMLIDLMKLPDNRELLP